MRRFLLVPAFLLLLVPYALSAEFRASRNSNKYHYPSCKWAQKIHPENLVKFSSADDAQKAGYIPCKVCRPPLGGR